MRRAAESQLWSGSGDADVDGNHGVGTGEVGGDLDETGAILRVAGDQGVDDRDHFVRRSRGQVEKIDGTKGDEPRHVLVDSKQEGVPVDEREGGGDRSDELGGDGVGSGRWAGQTEFGCCGRGKNSQAGGGTGGLRDQLKCSAGGHGGVDAG